LENGWGIALASLHERQINITTEIKKSTREDEIGADIGFVIAQTKAWSEFKLSADVFQGV
jgi:hypothetical protein